MDELMPPTLPGPPGAARMPLGARLINMFTGPGEVFEDVLKGPPSTANWLVPVILSCLVGMVSSFVIFSQDAITQQLKEKQEQALEKRLEKLPKEKREEMREMLEKWSNPDAMKLFGVVGAVARSFGGLYVAAAVLWLVGTRGLKGTFSFMQAVEVCGLAAMIGLLAAIVTMLLVVVMGTTLATPGPVLLIHEPDMANPAHLILSAFNILTLWYIGVLAIGLAKLSGASVAKSAVWLFGIWAAVTVVFVFGGFAAQKLF